MSIDRAMERVARSRVGQGILSVLIVILVGATVAWNLPPGRGPVRRREARRFGPGVACGRARLYALGLDQEWGVFAPPRQQVIGLQARIEYADGTESTWLTSRFHRRAGRRISGLPVGKVHGARDP